MIGPALDFLVVILACAINERMQKKIDCLQEEVRVLEDVITTVSGQTRLPLTDDQRRRLAIAVKDLTPKGRDEVCGLVKPATLLA